MAPLKEEKKASAPPSKAATKPPKAVISAKAEPKADSKDTKKKAASPAPVAKTAKAPEKHPDKQADKHADKAHDKKVDKKIAAPTHQKKASEVSDEIPAQAKPVTKVRKAREDVEIPAESVAAVAAPAPVASAPTASEDDEIFLTDADGRRYCRVKDCDQAATVDSYCRFHYLLFWKNIQNRKKIISEGKLARYVEELTSRYPDKYLELLRKDLRSEKDFTSAIQELEIDESSVDNELEDEAQSYLDEVRGMSSEPTNEREEDF
jgi:hypothetical protein